MSYAEGSWSSRKWLTVAVALAFASAGTSLFNPPNSGGRVTELRMLRRHSGDSRFDA